MDEVVFLVSALIILVGAVGVVASRNPVHSALFLVQTLFGVAVLFVLQDAHFLAAVQVIVYAGAIVILFLFVIMLLGVDRAESLEVEPIAGQRPLAVVIGASITGIVLTVVLVAGDTITGARSTDVERALDNGRSDVDRLGRVLFTDHAFAFEATAALLTIAVVGAVVLTRKVTGEVADIGEPASFDLPPVAPEDESQ
jgi:NADH-quinone oxidoreductase subunit J